MTQAVLTPTRTEIDAAIRQAAFDYLSGWDEADKTRYRRSLHPDLAKRIVRPNDSFSSAWPPGDRLDELTAMRRVQLAPPEPQPEYNRWTEVVILDRLPRMASIRLGGDTGLGTRKWGGEYDHVVLWNGAWVILHVHWGLYLQDAVNNDTEDATITSTVRDYVESYYERDATRIERTLHPHLVRRRVVPSGAPPSQLMPGDFLEHMTAYGLVQFVAERGVPTPKQARRADVTILDRVANT